MKLTKSLVALIAAALLPTLAYAGLDTISGFERGVYCNLATTTTTTVVIEESKPDPYEMAVVEAMNSTADPVLASYYRDLYYPSPSSETQTFVRTPDPYVDAISLALYGSVEPDSRRVC